MEYRRDNLNKKQIAVGENIRKWRELKCVKQLALAEQIGITAPALSNIENNKASINTMRLQQIASCLQIDVTMLFSDPLDLMPMNLKVLKR